MNTAWNRWCRNLLSGTALSLYDNHITPIIMTDITGRRNVRIQNPYTCTTSSDTVAYTLTSVTLTVRPYYGMDSSVVLKYYWYVT